VLSQQEKPAAFVRTKIAAGVQALKSGDLDSAEQVFSDALRQGIKHPLIYHNLGVIAQLRASMPKRSRDFVSPRSSTELRPFPLAPRFQPPGAPKNAEACANSSAPSPCAGRATAHLQLGESLQGRTTG